MALPWYHSQARLLMLTFYAIKAPPPLHCSYQYSLISALTSRTLILYKMSHSSTSSAEEPSNLPEDGQSALPTTLVTVPLPLDVPCANSRSLPSSASSVTDASTLQGRFSHDRHNDRRFKEHDPASDRRHTLENQAPDEQHHRIPSHYTRRHVVRAWAWEMATSVTAVSLLVAIIIIVRKQDNQPTGNWTFPVTLNSLIALLSTILRGSMVVIAAEILSQMKWMLLSPSTPLAPLSHFQKFDDASRGIWGTLGLIPIVFLRSPISTLCALTILLSFAVGPFTQQSLTTINRIVPFQSGIAALPVAQSIIGGAVTYVGGGLLDTAVPEVTVEAQNQILAAVLSPQNGEWSIKPDCSSGNCQFRSWESGVLLDGTPETTHASAGICSTCSDVTSLIQKQGVGPEWFYLPNDEAEVGNAASAPRLQVASTADLSWAESNMTHDDATKFRWSVTNITILAFNDTNQTPIAAVCSLYPCLRSYSANISEGHLYERLLDASPMLPVYVNGTGDESFEKLLGNLTDSDYEQWLSSVQSPCLVDNTVYTMENFSSYPNTTTVQIMSRSSKKGYDTFNIPDQCLFKFNWKEAQIIGSFLATRVFSGNCRKQLASLNCDKAPWLAQFHYQNTTIQTYNNILTYFSEALTNQFRQGTIGNGERGAPAWVSGVAFQTVPFTIVKWFWLTYPAVLVAIEVSVLAYVIVRSMSSRRKSVVWKSSVLPIFRYRDDLLDVRDTMSTDLQCLGKKDQLDLITLSEMRKDAHNITLKLVPARDRDTDQSANTENTRQQSMRVETLDCDSLLQG